MAAYIAANWPSRKHSAEILVKSKNVLQKLKAEYFKNTIIRDLLKQQQGEAALALIDAILTASQPSIAILNLAALALGMERRHEDAASVFEMLIAKAPQNAIVANNYGNLLVQLGRFDDARLQFEKAIALDPDYASPKYGLGGMLLDLADTERGLELMRQALELLSNDLETISPYLFSTLHQEGISVQERLRLARQYRNSLNCPTDVPRPALAKSGHRQLKVGFVAGDFRDHPVGYFTSSFLGCLGDAGMETTLYSNSGEITQTTQILTRQAKRFRPVLQLDDQSLLGLIRKDGIQVLIDLSGHTALNRLRLFALRPAPVQATWLGYFATTGVPEIDYIIGDEYVTPKQEQDQFVERIVHLDGGYLCLSQPGPTDVFPIGAPRPKEGVVFGSFANPRKLTPLVVDSWKMIMAMLPYSRLVLRAKQWEHATLQQMILQPFQAAGISADRVEFKGQTPRDAYLLGYNEIDVILDTFPYMGGTTTAEALFMGTPVAAKYGNDFASRIGLSILKSAGFGEWAAPSRDEYVATALELARASASGSLDKRAIREQALRSRLFDNEKFAESFVKCLHAMVVGIRN